MIFKNNLVYDFGSGIHIDSSKHIIITNTTFINNTALTEGGSAIMISEVDNLTISDTFVENNFAFKGNIWFYEVNGLILDNL